MDIDLYKLKDDFLNCPVEKQKIICWILKTNDEKITVIKKKMCFDLSNITEKGIEIIMSIIYENKIDNEYIYKNNNL